MKLISLLSIVVLAVGLPLVYAVGVLFEMELPHWWLLYRVRDARTVSGEPAAEVLRRHFGREADAVHWHTCGYCIDRPGRSAENLRHVQFMMRGRFFSFAYDPSKNQLVPMSAATAREFPELLPPGDRLVSLNSLIGDDEPLLPASWQTR